MGRKSTNQPKAEEQQAKPIDLDGEEQTNTEQQGEQPSEQQSEQTQEPPNESKQQAQQKPKQERPARGANSDTRPTFPAFLDGPKESNTGGEGTGGRPWVYSKDSGIRRERQGDASRPQCPGCTRDEVAVLCHATSSRDVTHYACPCCSFRTYKMRPEIAAQMRAGTYVPPLRGSFVERP